MKKFTTREEAEQWITDNQAFLRGELPEDYSPEFAPPD